MCDLKKAKYKVLDWVQKKDKRDRRKYRIFEIVECGRNLEFIGYILLYQKGDYLYNTVWAIAENALIPLLNSPK